jgi:hypothetical protein
VRCVGRGGLRGVLVAAALGALACRKPTPVDPAEAAYHAAVARFAEVSQLTQDLTYRDPRFDPVLDALDAIPAESEPKPHAMALADRIRGARALANSQERRSQLLQAQAEAPPAFEAQLRLPSGSTPNRIVPAVAQPQAAIAPGFGEPVGGVPAAKGAVKKLPSWYAGYFGTAEKSQDAGGAEANSAAATEPDSPPAKKPAPAAAPEPVGPPPVFGVPGPAGSALQGKPGTE